MINGIILKFVSDTKEHYCAHYRLILCTYVYIELHFFNHILYLLLINGESHLIALTYVNSTLCTYQKSKIVQVNLPVIQVCYEMKDVYLLFSQLIPCMPLTALSGILFFKDTCVFFIFNWFPQKSTAYALFVSQLKKWRSVSLLEEKLTLDL